MRSVCLPSLELDGMGQRGGHNSHGRARRHTGCVQRRKQLGTVHAKHRVADQQRIGMPVTQTHQHVERVAVRHHVAKISLYDQRAQSGQADSVVVNNANLSVTPRRLLL